MEAVAAGVTDLEWIVVEESSAPGRVRRAASAVAVRLGFSEHRAGEVAIAATELATNLHRHAQAGSVLIRERHGGGSAAVELILSDSGPGVADLEAAALDGRSSRGTLGIGLGAAMRFASWFDAHSVIGRGTVMVATFWQTLLPPVARPRVAALTRPFHGEVVCGDAWAERSAADGGVTLMLADGLGHGLLAAAASNEAVRTFLAEPPSATPAETLRTLHRALHPTRGAAIAVVRLDPAFERLTFSGIGNIAGWMDDGDRRHGLDSVPGIVGHNARKFRDVQIALPPGSTVVLHSDGLTAKWDLGTYPGLRVRDPHLVAATLLRDAGVRHDDAAVMVARVS